MGVDVEIFDVWIVDIFDIEWVVVVCVEVEMWYLLIGVLLVECFEIEL